MKNKNRPDNPACKLLVARTRFELVISALRGRRPEPLDERAVCGARLRRKDITGTGTGAQGGFVRKSNLWMTCGGALDWSGLARGPADGTGLRAGCRTGLVRWVVGRGGLAGRVLGRSGLACGSPVGTGMQAGPLTGRTCAWAVGRNGSAGRVAISSRITEAAPAPGSPACAHRMGSRSRSVFPTHGPPARDLVSVSRTIEPQTQHVGLRRPPIPR